MAIETSGAVGSVAALLDGAPAGEISFQRGMRHGRDLVPHLSELCRRLGRGPADIDVVAVSVGPGSYTGVRVGVTCAKMLAVAPRWLDAPPGSGSHGGGPALVAVSTLEVLAQNALPEEPTDPLPFEQVAAVCDARRGRLYAAFFRRDGRSLLRATSDLLIEPRELPRHLQPGTLVVGDAVVRCAEALGRACAETGGVRLGGEASAVARARHVARLGWREFGAGRTVAPHDLVPVYLRKPEALERRAGPGGEGRGH